MAIYDTEPESRIEDKLRIAQQLDWLGVTSPAGTNPSPERASRMAPTVAREVKRDASNWA